MNRINPFYILALLVIVFLFLLFKLSNAHEQLSLQKQNYKQTQKMALELSGLKKLYAKSTKTSRALRKILSQPSLKDAKIELKESKKLMKITSKKLTKKALHSLMNKILNGSYNIKKLKIKRLTKTEVSLDMEIAL